MKIEQDDMFHPITITIENIEEQRALWFLGCSRHMSLKHLADCGGPNVPTRTKSDVLELMLEQFAITMVPR